MAHTNSTTNYSLPQFVPTDKPAWLTDINGAFSDLDTAVYTAQTKANDAYTNAGAAQGDATTALTNAAAADAKGAGALASIEVAFDPTTVYSVGARVIYNSLLYRCTVAVVTPGPWTGSDNWERITVDGLISTTDSKIGQLTSLNTIDKTSVVNAINEINGSLEYNVGDTISASITKICAGRSTSAGDKVVFFYPLPKVISTTSARLIISANTAYAWRSDGGPVDLTAGTYTAAVTDGGLYIIADLGSVVTGNRSMNVELSNRTIEFFNN